VEVLTSYSHTTHLADLQLRLSTHRSDVALLAQPASKRPWSLRDRLDDGTRADMIAADRAGTTAASLAAEYGLSLRSVKRFLADAGARRQPFTA
jgi:hypothetical protein